MRKQVNELHDEYLKRISITFPASPARLVFYMYSSLLNDNDACVLRRRMVLERQDVTEYRQSNGDSTR